MSTGTYLLALIGPMIAFGILAIIAMILLSMKALHSLRHAIKGDEAIHCGWPGCSTCCCQDSTHRSFGAMVRLNHSLAEPP